MAPVEPVVIQDSAFRKQISDLNLSVVSSPGLTIKHVPFSKPYTVRALYSDGTPAGNFQITVSYPESRSGESIIYGTSSIKTDTTGTAVFNPPVPDCAFDSHILFQPSIPSADPELAKIAAGASVQAPWKVRTDFIGKGGIICLVDCDLKGSPSSSKLLISMMTSGFTNIGNVDFSKEIKSGNQQAVYDAAHSLVGNSAAFFVYGIVKYAKPVEKTADGFTCELEGDIICLDMKNGKQLYSMHKTTGPVVEKTEWKLPDTAKQILAKEITASIIYGM